MVTKKVTYGAFLFSLVCIVTLHTSQSPLTASSTSPFVDRLSSRIIRVGSYALRATVGGIAQSASAYNIGTPRVKAPEDEAPDIVKEFCYAQAGRRNFNVKSHNHWYNKNFFTTTNTLWVPTTVGDLQSTLQKEQKLKQEKYDCIEKLGQEDTRRMGKSFTSTPGDYYSILTWRMRKINEHIDENQQELALFKGIIDHEITHLNNYDAYRHPFFGLTTFVTLYGSLIRNISQLDQKFNKAVSRSKTVREVLATGRRLLVRAGLTTVLYNASFVAINYYIERTIEAQADAGVRDDIQVLEAMKKFFNDLAALENGSYMGSEADRMIMNFFSSHPSHKSRADYFEQRLQKLLSKTKSGTSGALGRR